MQKDSSGRAEPKPLKLQDVDATHGFPSHVAHILNPGKPIFCTEIFCRLLHVCLIETGFIPVIDDEPDFDPETLFSVSMNECVPKLVRKLERILNKVGNLHNVNYTAIVFDNPQVDSSVSSTEEINNLPTEEFVETFQQGDYPSTSANAKENSTPVTSKENGDRSLATSSNNTATAAKTVQETKVVDTDRLVSSLAVPQVVEKQKLSGNISVSVIHEGLFIYAVANGPAGLHKNAQISIEQYIRPKNSENFPFSAKLEDYYQLLNFSIIRFVDDVKRGFCYPIMDEIDSLSFEIRSLSWFPPEIIVQIAKWCSPLAVFRLRATCSEIRTSLSETNQQFWKMMLKRDFPQYNLGNLKSDLSGNKFFKKYSEMCNLTFRRPVIRRTTIGRMLPYYYLSNFRL